MRNLLRNRQNRYHTVFAHSVSVELARLIITRRSRYLDVAHRHLNNIVEAKSAGLERSEIADELALPMMV